MSNFTQQDLEDLARCGWMEARGEGDDGMRAVMHVILNRCVQFGFPKTIHDVIYQPNAFSWTRSDDPEHNMEPKNGDAQYTYCLRMAPAIIDGTDPDNSNGAIFYANESRIASGSWYWSHIIMNIAHPITAVVGHQTFRS